MADLGSEVVDTADPLPQPLDDALVESAISALRDMAGLSLRRQADLDVAFKRARLAISPDRYSELLQRLQHRGLVRDVVALRDGGILITLDRLG